MAMSAQRMPIADCQHKALFPAAWAEEPRANATVVARLDGNRHLTARLPEMGFDDYAVWVIVAVMYTAPSMHTTSVRIVAMFSFSC